MHSTPKDGGPGVLLVRVGDLAEAGDGVAEVFTRRGLRIIAV
jgi:hypothetical protein